MNSAGAPAATAAAKAAVAKATRISELAAVVQSRVAAFYHDGHALSSVRARADLAEIRVLTVGLRKVLLADRKTLEAEREAGLSDSDASVPRNGH
ncbi:hypothetical protein I4F81_011309 [Pyropia yezoensis]|uniref:Uncharacterized protein n=1 Tax=Pyropia yezoensis TaxID=2788 RepID=A0ACC3CFR2_PYRYE|nr:hypothetical protein I4F81_011309 [Neopyropia yezoensis]